MALGSKQYASVTWTTGDQATETKMDNMVNNDQAYDAHAAEGLLLNNNVGYWQKDSGGTNRNVANINSSDNLVLGENTLRPTRFVVREAPATADKEGLTEAAYTDWDLLSEGLVSSRAFAVLIYLTIADNTAGSYIGVRKNGHTDPDQEARCVSIGSDVTVKDTVYVECDANGVIEIAREDNGGTGPISTAARASVVGYWEYLD